MDPSALKSELKQLILRELDLRTRTEEDIKDDAPLFGVGLGLDSLDALQLAVAIEERYGVTIPEGDVGREIFATVATLAAHIADTSTK
jgi:acyl carrier protein